MQDVLPRDALRTVRTPTAAAPAYVRHRPEHMVLYAVVEDHADAFMAQMGEQWASLPVYVHRELERYLRCGRLEEG